MSGLPMPGSANAAGPRLASGPGATLRLLIVMAAALAATVWLDPYSVKLVAKVFALWIVVLGLQLLIAHAGVLSLGHAAFVAVGAYVAGALSVAGEHTLWTMIGAVGLASLVAGLLVGLAVLRTQGLYQLMATLAIAQMTYYGLRSLRAMGGDDGFALDMRPVLFDDWTLESDWAIAGAVIIGAGLCAVLVTRLRLSEFGARMQAGRDDEQRLSSLGVNPFGVKLAAFVVSAMLAGLGGAALAHISAFASPQLGHWLFSGELMVLVLLGGGATRIGPLLACAALVVLQEVLSQYTEHWPLALGLLVLGRVLWPTRGGAHP